MRIPGKHNKSSPSVNSFKSVSPSVLCMLYASPASPESRSQKEDLDTSCSIYIDTPESQCQCHYATPSMCPWASHSPMTLSLESSLWLHMDTHPTKTYSKNPCYARCHILCTCSFAFFFFFFGLLSLATDSQ